MTEQNNNIDHKDNKKKNKTKDNSTNDNIRNNKNVKYTQHKVNSPFFLQNNSIRMFYTNMAKMKIHEYIDRLVECQWDPTLYHILFQEVFLPYAKVSITTQFQNHIKKTHHLFSFMLAQTINMIETPTVSYFEIQRNQFVTEVLSNETIYFTAPMCSLTCHYRDGSKMKYNLHFNGQMNLSWKIMSLDIVLDGFKSNLDYKLVEELLLKEQLGQKLFELIEQKNKDKEIIDLVRSNFQCFQDLSHLGINNELIKLFQINDIMSCLHPLRVFQKKHNIASPREAMKLFINSQNHPDSSSGNSETQNS